MIVSVKRWWNRWLVRGRDCSPYCEHSIDFDAALGAWQDTPLTTCGECLGDGKIVVGTLLSGVGDQLRTMKCHDCNGAGFVLNEGIALMNAIAAAVGDTHDGSS